MSNLGDTVEGNDTKRARFSSFAFASDNGILQKNNTLRNWFLKPTADYKGECGGKAENSINDAKPNDKNSQSSIEEKKLGRKVRAFFRQTNSSKDGGMSEDEEDASFWRKASNKGPKKEESPADRERQRGSFTKKIRNSIFKHPINGNEKDYNDEKNLLLPVEFSSDDENASHFTDANSHIIQSKSPEKLPSRNQSPTKGTNNKGQSKEYGSMFEEDSDGDEFSPDTPPENVLEGPYKFVFQTPNTFTSQPQPSVGEDFHNGGRYVIEYLSKRLTALNIEIDFESGRKADIFSEKELHRTSEKIIESIANEISTNETRKKGEQDELEKVKLENSRLSKFKHEHSLQKQEIISLKTKLESTNKKNNDLIIEMEKLKGNTPNERRKDYIFTDENENGDVIKSNTEPGVLKLNVNETSAKPQEAKAKPLKYLPRETRNNETRLRYLEKKISGLEKSLEKKKRQMKTNDVRIDLNKFTVDQFLNLLKSLNAVLQFHNVYGNNLKDYNDDIIKIETYCSVLNTNDCFEEPSLRLQENSFKRQLSPLFSNVNFSLIDQLTMNFKFYERSANFQKETIGGLRIMLEEKDNYIKTLMQHLKKKAGTKLIKDSKNVAST
ncbi:Ysw1p SKDI_02G2580 [Saccharomyces kudriavzevii IFO 1802]|uniref:Uncharacterized protein n=2 Tax=Saccharomyces kudriavzevii (strain ATCC MYA-4449 / AS 2.2408 / CBS 8840 / NBRC 1802 / NCYC 2889) TaxID=226230 RepID=A0AA35NPP2_SACK1|nr:uncharacterized protein SKDI_02G2580 [Saccharomyces kudriavzevii IFO 1802]EJT43759.1 YSW1-like protein [Saccharomyces kudriavzevii IFO 1802]CAI4055661.1 hypothetical protein SKDI_02G2580 [Saccharomyces kudriavzevii IFO 1802]